MSRNNKTTCMVKPALSRNNKTLLAWWKLCIKITKLLVRCGVGTFFQQKSLFWWACSTVAGASCCKSQQRDCRFESWYHQKEKNRSERKFKIQVMDSIPLSISLFLLLANIVLLRYLYQQYLTAFYSLFQKCKYFLLVANYGMIHQPCILEW